MSNKNVLKFGGGMAVAGLTAVYAMKAMSSSSEAEPEDEPVPSSDHAPQYKGLGQAVHTQKLYEPPVMVQRKLQEKVPVVAAPPTQIPAAVTASTKKKKKPRRAPVKRVQEDSFLGRMENIIYPDSSKYFWYREGLVSRSGPSGRFISSVKYFLLCAMAGSGTLIGVLIYLLSLFLIFVQHLFGTETNLEPQYMGLVEKPWFCVFMMLLSGTVTVSCYHFGAQRLEQEFDVERKDDPENWKCQPDKVLSEDKHWDEIKFSLCNAFMAGILGMGLFLRHLNHPFLKLYYENRGWMRFFGDAMIVFQWIELWAYCAHRTLHHKSIYKHVHKLHHRFQAPTAYSAFAMHPLEFLLFQSGGVACTCVFDIHILAFFAVVLMISYHGQVDHSGVYFQGEFLWQPSVKYHDDHHSQFHCNFGQNIIFWDWFFDTLRSKQKKYGEEVFADK